jgi:putative transposase
MESNPRRTLGHNRGNRRHLDIEGLPFPVHISIASLRRMPFFSDQSLALETFRIQEGDPTTRAACLLPDHLHWIRRDCHDLAAAIGRFKSLSTHRAWRFGVTGKLWQRSYWDRVIRDEVDLRKTIRYLESQPIKHGLVENAEAYPFLFVRDAFP